MDERRDRRIDRQGTKNTDMSCLAQHAPNCQPTIYMTCTDWGVAESEAPVQMFHHLIKLVQCNVTFSVVIHLFPLVV